MVTGTANNDVIEGVFSALSSESTLNAGDKIDGGEGNDTLKVDLKGNFTGFTGEGYLKNVETVELTNGTTIARTFDAKGVTGVEEYKLNGQVNLANLADAKAAISISNIADTAGVTLGYTADAVKGTADKLTLNVNALGTAEVKASAGVAAVGQKDVTITANGIEELTVNTTGDNFVKLVGDKVEKITVAGAGSISTDVTANAKKFDASANTGKVSVDLANAAGVTEVATGAGDDVIKAGVTAGTADLALNAIIAGGAGNDRLELDGVKGTVQYQMTGVETVSLANATAVTFSAAKSTGIETIVAQSTLNGANTFAGLGASDMAINLLGANGNAGAITADHSGTSTVNVTASAAATAAAQEVNKLGVTASNSSQLKLNVGTNAKYEGTITAGKATSVEVNGTVSNAKITAGEATSAVLNTTGASTLNLDAAKLTALQATVAAGTATVTGGLNLKAASTLTALQSLEASIGANSKLEVGNLAKVNTITLTGAGEAELGNLGATTLEYGVTVSADGLKKLKVGKIETAAGQSINVTAATVLGDVTVGDVTVAGNTGAININVNGTTGDVDLGGLKAKSVTVDATGALGEVFKGSSGAAVGITADTVVYNGTELKANEATITTVGETFTATLNGGIADDIYIIIGDAATKSFTVKGDLGINTGAGDSLTITGAAATQTIDVTGVVGAEALEIDAAAAVGNLTIKGSAGADKIKVGGAFAAATGNANYTITGGAGADEFEVIKTAAKKTVATITDFKAGEDVLTLATAAVFDQTATAVDVVAALGNFGVTATAADVKFVKFDIDGAAAGTDGGVGVLFNGDVYVFEGHASLTSAGVISMIKLTGLSDFAADAVAFA